MPIRKKRPPSTPLFASQRHAAALFYILAACSIIFCRSISAGNEASISETRERASVDTIAENFVKLALALGEHDAFYVDAYFGPEAWWEDAKKEQRPLKDIRQAAAPLVMELKAMKTIGENESLGLRRAFLTKQLESLSARAGMLDGRRMQFDEESKELYDIVAPRTDEGGFRKIIHKIDALLPRGEGALADRLDRSYVINYNTGYDLVKRYIEKRVGTAKNPVKRWEELRALISYPRIPSELE